MNQNQINQSIKLLLVGNFPLVEESLKNVLSNNIKVKMIGSCTESIEVIQFLGENDVDIILMDFRMKNMDGAETTVLVKNKYPEVKVIGFSCDDAYGKSKMISSGADDFLSKYDWNLELMMNKIDLVWSKK